MGKYLLTFYKGKARDFRDQVREVNKTMGGDKNAKGKNGFVGNRS